MTPGLGALFGLDGRRVLITGGGGGLGSAIARALATQGADVAIADVKEQVAKAVVARLAEEIPARSVVDVSMDVTNEDSVAAAVGQAADRLGGSIDVVVTAAGVGELQEIETMSFAQWRRMLTIHLDGTFLAIRHTLPAMLERGFGRIICFSSIAATQGVEKQAHYSAAKAGVDGLVRSLAREVADRGVTVNAIAPGYFETPLNDLASVERLSAIVGNIPVGRFGHPSEIGALTSYLASDEAAYLTGETVSPHGGFRYCRHLGD